MSARRRISVVTGSRAEYWLMRPLLDLLRRDETVELDLIATGSHLSERFGNTVRDIEDDGFRPRAVPVLDESDGPLAVADALARGIAGMARAFQALPPDLVVVLGDRYEILAAAQAALVMTIPVAHLFGGELTEGAMDDSIRHALTKLSQLHFVSTEEYRRRVIQLGEDPARVFTVGSVGVEAVLRLDPMPADVLEADLGAPLSDPLFLVTWHPETLAENGGLDGLAAMLSAFEDFPEARIVMTGVNADPGHAAVAAACAAFAAAHPGRVTLHTSLGQRRYLSVMKLAGAVVGNSSSGVIEAPAMRVPTVNIGGRQGGRLRSASILDCAPTRLAVAQALATALDPAFRQRLASQALPFQGCDYGAMARILATADLVALSHKKFHDLPVPTSL